MADLTTVSDIEKGFPRIVIDMTLQWGRPEFSQLLDHLLFDERGDRQGFPGEVLAELMFLKVLHEIRLHGSDSPNDRTIWSDPEYSRNVAHGGSD